MVTVLRSRPSLRIALLHELAAALAVDLHGRWKADAWYKVGSIRSRASTRYISAVLTSAWLSLSLSFSLPKSISPAYAQPFSPSKVIKAPSVDSRPLLRATKKRTRTSAPSVSAICIRVLNFLTFNSPEVWSKFRNKEERKLKQIYQLRSILYEG